MCLKEAEPVCPARSIRPQYTETASFDSIPQEELVVDQGKDECLTKVVTLFEKGERRKWKEVQPESSEVKTLWSFWTQLVFRDRVLFKKCSITDNDAVGCITSQMCQLVHGGKFGGHLGATKTLYKVKQRFW